MPPRVGPYLLERKLGSGGMGTVYLGTHAETGEHAAVKILPAALAREPGFRERFAREVETVRRLNNPHIAGYLASGAVDAEGNLLPEPAPGENAEPADDALAFLALRYVEGETLLVRLRRERRLSWRAAVDLGIQICAALKAAHDAGVVHRDLKPSNLILTPDPQGDPAGVGHVTLVDFGVAQLFAAGRLTQTGGVIGTAEFMAPEQATGKRVDKKCDLYSLGAVLYACVCGAPPFRGKSAVEVLQQHRFGQFDAPRRYAPDCPPAVEAVLTELLAKSPADRPADARVVSNRLSAAVRREDYAAGTLDGESKEPGGESAGVGRETAGESVPLPDRPTRPAADEPAAHEGGEPASTAPGMGGATVERSLAGTSLHGAALSQEDAAGAADENLAFPRGGPGPATIVRNGVVQALEETDETGPVGRFFEQTWVLVAALALLVAGGVLWFELQAPVLPPPGEMTVGQHLAAARAALEQSPSAAWMRARDRHLTPLLAPEGIERIEERSAQADNPGEPLTPEARAYTLEQARRMADRVRRYELETAARRPTLAGPPANESERFLRLAAHQTLNGDRPAAARTLRHFLAATSAAETDARLAQNRRIAESMLNDLAVPPPAVSAMADRALDDARAAAEAGDPAAARRVLDGLIGLYADDPAAETLLQDARVLRRSLEPASMEQDAAGR
ncbi:serine/threonine-protein kinase [Alienimonas sp. DA493]|uniref:serine/threonine-protein kinase n=1 Tax=Alienimonas sp. DA493 TaxID=3373605 RepID=UPI003754BC00